MNEIEREQLSTYHNKLDSDHFKIDKQTREDLNTDDFYSDFNNTYTTYGDSVFYHKINSQPTSINTVRGNVETLKLFKNNSRALHSINKHLSKIGKQSRGNIFKDLWDGVNYSPRFISFLPFWLLLIPILINASFIVSPFIGLVSISITLVVNLVIFILTNNRVNYTAGSMKYLAKSITALKKLKKDPLLKNILRNLKYDKNIEKVSKYSLFLKDGIGFINPLLDTGSAFIDYTRVFLCSELFAFYRISKHLKKYRKDLKTIMEFIGEIDFYTNCCNITKNYDTSIPTFHKEKSISFTDLKHPLVKKCLPYNMEIDNSMIITGMNMAGKSTYLKSIALNQLLATSFGFTFSKFFSSSLYFVVSSIKIKDNLDDGKSKYYVEAERLLYIQNLVKNNKVLCIIDEILTGTNTKDRISASIGILKNYYRSNSMILSATHDTEIAEALSDTYSCYYFDGNIKDKSIVYDFKPQEGIISKSNALLLLSNMGVHTGI